jgi:prepilin-type N-terminal cleavage/methylation domain-containing protein
MKVFCLKRAFKGFTIIEILIAIIIIGILVAVIIPRLATRSGLARKRACESDLEQIRKAQEHAGIDTGYYYRLYVLDDNPGGDAIGTGGANDVIDGVRDEYLNTIASNPRQLFIHITTGQDNSGDLYNSTASAVLYNRLTSNETDFNWNGRYITWQKDFNFNDIPDDPWNHDYLFFTEKGLVLEPDGLVVATCSIDASGNLTTGGAYNCEKFDRFTVLSMGPDGIPGSGTGTDFGSGDDIIQQW